MTDRPVSGEQSAAEDATVEFRAVDGGDVAPTDEDAASGAAGGPADEGRPADGPAASGPVTPSPAESEPAADGPAAEKTTPGDGSANGSAAGGSAVDGSAVDGAAEAEQTVEMAATTAASVDGSAAAKTAADAPGVDAKAGTEDKPAVDRTVGSGGGRHAGGRVSSRRQALNGEATEEHAGGRAGSTAELWRRPVVLIPAAVVAGLLALYGIAFAIAGNSLARDATVLGIDVGGLSSEEAESLLATELPPLIDEPVDVEVPTRESTFSLTPSEAGLGIDVAATVREVPGGSANPVSLVAALFGGGSVDPVPEVDRAALEDAVEAIAEQSDVEPVNGGVAFDDGEVVTSAAEIGSELDVTATADAVERAFFGGEGPYEMPLGAVTAEVDEVPPSVTDSDVERAAAEFGEPAMSGPVRVVAGDRTVEVTPEMISPALEMSPDAAGVLEPELDSEELAESADDVLAELGEPGHDASIRIQGGQPAVVPSESGAGIGADELASAVLPVLSNTGDERVAEVEYSEVEPEFTTEDAEALGVETVISEYTTRFPHAQYRNTNIGLAAQKIDGTLLKPGDTFSLNGIVGERTAANGFARGGTISGGVLVQDYGGGVSQVATTTYHAAFNAGLEDVEHKPHSIYFDRYPVAAEATVSWGNFDMAFQNDTPYGVLVEALFSPSSSGSQGVLTVRLWSTKYYEVETSLSERSNFTAPSTIYNDQSNCIPNSSGSSGFSITSYRQVRNPDGELVKDEAYPWTYRPNPIVICGEEPSDDDD